MDLRKTLLASSALAMLATAGEAQASNVYISVFGGPNWQSDSSARTTLPDTSNFNVDPDTGFVLGGAVGAKLTNWVRGLRAEMEIAYRRNDLGGNWTTSTGDTGGIIDANSSNFSIMANVWYDFDCGWKIRPYVGGGVGWARAKLDGAVVTTFTDGGPDIDTYTTLNVRTSGFAWQLGLGFNYEVAPGVDVGLGYRFFKGPEHEDVFFFGKNASLDIDNENHSALVNFTVHLN